MAGKAIKQSHKPGLLRRLYEACMAWIQTPYGLWALFLIAVGLDEIANPRLRGVQA